MAEKKFKIVSIRAYARHKGVSDTTVHKARKNGVLTEECFTVNEHNGRPMIYQELADLDWSKNYNPNYTRKTKGKEGDTDEKTNHETISGKGLVNNQNTKTLTEIKRQEGEVNLHLKLLTLKERRGELVNKVQVYNDLYELGKQVKSDLQILPDRIIDDLRAVETREEAHALMLNSINEILERLANMMAIKKVA